MKVAETVKIVSPLLRCLAVNFIGASMRHCAMQETVYC
jgi:hypothetical protein